LGVDEVLLLATDSGNVTGYNVEAIFSAINRSTQAINRANLWVAKPQALK
jgi:hypothetical protein